MPSIPDKPGAPFNYEAQQSITEHMHAPPGMHVAFKAYTLNGCHLSSLARVRRERVWESEGGRGGGGAGEHRHLQVQRCPQQLCTLWRLQIQGHQSIGSHGDLAGLPSAAAPLVQSRRPTARPVLVL